MQPSTLSLLIEPTGLQPLAACRVDGGSDGYRKPSGTRTSETNVNGA